MYFFLIPNVVGGNGGGAVLRIFHPLPILSNAARTGGAITAPEFIHTLNSDYSLVGLVRYIFTRVLSL